MKHRVLIRVMAAVLLSACHRPVETVHAPSPHLVAIDSLMQSRPDSALKVLMDFESHDTLDEHYAQLLASELLYKNYYAQTNRLELLEAMAYFDSIGDPFLSARCHYMNGVGYYEMDSVVPACGEYLKALEIMEDHYKEEELTGYKAKFMALVFSHLCELFSDQYLHEQAIYFGTQSLSYYDRYDAEPWHVAWILEKIGSHYHIMEQRDSAEYYYRRAEEVLDGMNNLSLRDNIAQQAFLSYEKGEDYQVSINKLYEIIRQAESEEECLARYLTVGDIFIQEKLYDSACTYLSLIFNRSQNFEIKKQAAEWLVEAFTVQGRVEEAREYALFLVPFANQDENNSATKSKLSELYKTFNQKDLERRHEVSTRKYIKLTIIILGGLLAATLLVLFLYHRKRMELSRLVCDEQTKNKNWNNFQRFMGESICKQIVSSIQDKTIKRTAVPTDYPELILNDGQLQQLALTVNRYFGPIEKRLEQRGITSNPVLVNLCHLYLLGLNEKQSAMLLNRDYSSIKRYENKLKSAFQTKENMALFIKSIILNE